MRGGGEGVLVAVGGDGRDRTTSTSLGAADWPPILPDPGDATTGAFDGCACCRCGFGSGLTSSTLGGSTTTTSIGSSSRSGVLDKKLPIPEASKPICNASEPSRLKARKDLRALASFSRCCTAMLDKLIL